MYLLSTKACPLHAPLRTAKCNCSTIVRGFNIPHLIACPYEGRFGRRQEYSSSSGPAWAFAGKPCDRRWNRQDVCESP